MPFIRRDGLGNNRLTCLESLRNISQTQLITNDRNITRNVAGLVKSAISEIQKNKPVIIAETRHILANETEFGLFLKNEIMVYATSPVYANNSKLSIKVSKKYPLTDRMPE